MGKFPPRWLRVLNNNYYHYYYYYYYYCYYYYDFNMLTHCCRV